MPLTSMITVATEFLVGTLDISWHSSAVRIGPIFALPCASSCWKTCSHPIAFTHSATLLGLAIDDGIRASMPIFFLLLNKIRKFTNKMIDVSSVHHTPVL